MNDKWIKWIIASITKHIDDNKGTTFVYFEGATPDLNEEEDRFEVRFNGPEITPLPGNEYQFDIEVNILVRGRVDNTDPYKMPRMVGLATLLLPKAFEIYRYGGDGDALEGCLEQSNKITVTNFSTDKENDLSFSTVECSYTTTLN